MFQESFTINANLAVDPNVFPNPPVAIANPNGLRYTRRLEKVVDVGGLTQNGAATLRVDVVVRDETPQSTEGHADGLLVSAWVHNDIRFIVNETPRAFTPVASNDPAASCSLIDRNCYPEYTARIVYQQPTEFIEVPARLQGRIRFRLTSISDLRGLSSNEGTGASADYTIDPAKQEVNLFQPPTVNPSAVTILTQSAQLETARLLVSSMDYGGRARLIADFLPGNGNDPVSAEIDDAAQPNRAYASLPVDEDGNWIADEWEKLYAQAAGVGDSFPNRRWDRDLGATGANTPNQYRGDALAAHDEYRGFHYIRPNGDLAHVRTDPGRTQDVFYLDGSQPPSSGGARPFTEALEALLFPRVAPGIIFHAVDDARGEINGLGRLNRNSAFSQEQDFSPAYPLVFESENLGRTSCQGALATSNVTYMRSRQPIVVRPDLISQCAADHNFPELTIRAMVIAHETGHRLGLLHYIRGTQYDSSIAAPFTTVPRARYAIDLAMPTDLYNRAAITTSSPGQVTLDDRIVASGSVLVGNQLIGQSLVGVPNQNATSWPIRFVFAAPIPTTGGTVFFEEIRQLIMDWRVTYPPSLQLPAGWAFSLSGPDDLRRMCVKCDQ